MKSEIVVVDVVGEVPAPAQHKTPLLTVPTNMWLPCVCCGMNMLFDNGKGPAIHVNYDCAAACKNCVDIARELASEMVVDNAGWQRSVYALDGEAMFKREFTAIILNMAQQGYLGNSMRRPEDQ